MPFLFLLSFCIQGNNKHDLCALCLISCGVLISRWCGGKVNEDGQWAECKVGGKQQMWPEIEGGSYCRDK